MAGWTARNQVVLHRGGRSRQGHSGRGVLSPRSAEFIDAAKRRLALARGGIDNDPAGSLSVAYYAMFYAARAALSERDAYAKTHAGTWNLFHEQFVETDQFNRELLAQAREVQRERENADYEAWAAPRAETERVLAIATDFLAAVEQLITRLNA